VQQNFRGSVSECTIGDASMTAGVEAPITLGFVGGTGPEGTGLALRFAAAGHPVIIGSRDAGRAQEVAARLSGGIKGEENAQAVSATHVVFLTVPYPAQAGLLPSLAEAIGSRVVINTIAPVVFEKGRPRPVAVPDGSAAQEAQRLLPNARVVAAFHHLSAKHLANLSHPLEGDVLVCGDDREAKQAAMELVRELRELRPVDAGDLAYASVLESVTALLIGINRRYRTESGVRITGL